MSRRASYDKVRRRAGTQLTVNANRLERRVAKLDTGDLLSLYEEGSNLYFHGENMDKRALGAMLMGAAVHVLTARYPQVSELDLTEPFPLRDWFNGVPQEQAR